MNSLSAQALKVVSAYESLPFDEVTGVSVPYFNNKRTGNRGGFRAHKGKGTPEEIVEEALIFAKQKNLNLSTLTPAQVKEFLVEHKLGVDCSGFVFHILSAEARSRGITLGSRLSFAHKSLLRRIIARFRLVENTSVLDFVRNSKEISLSEIAPGDIITIVPPQSSSDRDHMLVILSVEGTNVTYAHSMQYSVDGTWNHGLKRGHFIIRDPLAPLHLQEFSEGATPGTDLPLVGILSRSDVSVRRILPVSAK
jgi:hypothetical protein